MSIERGQIYFVNLDPVQGREQAGQRPVLVISVVFWTRNSVMEQIADSRVRQVRHGGGRATANEPVGDEVVEA